MEYLKPTDEIYMHRCLQLAANGRGSTSPNPMVGAVIVHNGRIIGEGFHIRAGEPHAEVNAVKSVKDSDKHLLTKSTIYVSLEPCSHYGKTPPCCDLIISCGIPRVVIGITDTNSQVNGKGIERMKNAGIEVITGILQKEAAELNRTFFKLHGKKRPYITLKWAETSDKFIDYIREEGSPLAISNAISRMAVHKLRSESDAILVGTRTALLDNPSLTTRHWAGGSPLRLVIDRDNKLPTSLRLFDGELPTVIYTASAAKEKYGKNITQVEVDFSTSVIPQILDHLATININSLLVEGGAKLLQSFIDADLWDTIRVERNPHLKIDNGVPAPLLPQSLKAVVTKSLDNEILCFTR